MYLCICVFVYLCVCVFVCGHVVQRVGNSSGSSSHFIINHLKASSGIQSFSWEFLCVLLLLTIHILIIDNHKVNFLRSNVFKLSPVVHLRVCRARNNPRRVCNIGSEQPTLHCIATLWLHQKRLHSGFALVAVLWCFSARDLQIAAAGWPITSVPTKISGVADFSTFCGLICPPVATPPQSQRFGEEWTKKKSRKIRNLQSPQLEN